MGTIEDRGRRTGPRRVLVTLAPLATIAVVPLVLRVAVDRPLLSAFVTTLVTLTAVAAGLVLYLRAHGKAWRLAWILLALSLAVQTITTTHSAAVGLPRTFPIGSDWLDALAAVVAGLAIARLISSRAPGRALDAALEGSLIAAACTYAPWAWGVTNGVSRADAFAALLPVAIWITVTWLLVRLLFLTTEQVAAYHFLLGAFVCLLITSATLAGARLGQVSDLRRAATAGIALCAFCLWGIAAAHPSLKRSFDATPPRSSPFGPWRLTLCIAANLVAPLTLLVVARRDHVTDLDALIAGSVVVPLLLAMYLIRQVRDRSRAEYRAQHDPLTGLPNRTLFHDRVEVAIGNARRTDSGLAVMFLDLDRFKSINDSLGHAVGNQLLQAVAKRLRAAMRESDTVARMGGDEFTVLLGSIDDPEDAAIAARKIVDVFAASFQAGGRELHTTTSIGIALYPGDGDDVDTLLKNADSAMYRAKARGRDAFEFYTPDLSVRAQARLSVESGLRHAIERHGLELYYQPQVDVATGAVVGLEALARWPHQKIGMVLPDVFVPIAEETGLIVSLGDWAIDAACADLRRWLNAGIAPRSVAVNLSARQLSEPELVDKVVRTLDRHGVPPNLLELEITESIFMRDLAHTTETLAALRELGVRCSIDDFGTGFSGLGYLAHMPIDTLKIDQSFVAHVQHAGDDAPIIEAIIGLARSLHLEVVAEGVESIEQVRFLVARGCTEMQGYLFSPALPADEIEHLLLLSDATTIDWLGMTDLDARFEHRPMTRTVRVTDASRLLSAICGGGQQPDTDNVELEAIIAALLPPDTTVPAPSTLRSASKRIAAGAFIGIVPVTTGLAAAHALPVPVQNAVAAAYDRAGVSLPRDANPVDTPDVVLLSDGRPVGSTPSSLDRKPDVGPPGAGTLPARGDAPSSAAGVDDTQTSVPDTTPSPAVTNQGRATNRGKHMGAGHGRPTPSPADGHKNAYASSNGHGKHSVTPSPTTNPPAPPSPTTTPPTTSPANSNRSDPTNKGNGKQK